MRRVLLANAAAPTLPPWHAMTVPQLRQQLDLALAYFDAALSANDYDGIDENATAALLSIAMIRGRYQMPAAPIRLRWAE